MGRPSISSGAGNENGNTGIPHGLNGACGGGKCSSPAWLQSGNCCDMPCNDWCYPCGPPQCCTPYYCPPNRPTVYPPPIFIPYRVDWYQARLC